MPSRASSSLDLVVTMSCGLTLIDLSSLPHHFVADTGGLALLMAESLALSITFRTQELYTQPHALKPHVLKDRWREERTGSSFLNFFHVVVESSQPSAAESMSPREQKEATTYSLSDSTWTLLCGLPSKGHAVTWHHVHLISVSFA